MGARIIGAFFLPSFAKNIFSWMSFMQPNFYPLSRHFQHLPLEKLTSFSANFPRENMQMRKLPSKFILILCILVYFFKLVQFSSLV
ncbi:hypothetical protein ES332_D10G119900v1 [Gossypium tomentosum]|uniref:Uncharacterized protein n=1 Tax=Gossypium tomentosum TaxID=34277 RepID=A0A5D2J4K7_GOSTO|nr:hypothetical protein ES332_D10G119900v1 [Gossypium tomentosum]